MMPKALTMEEKVAKVENKIAVKEEKKTRGTRASFNGTQGKLRVNFKKLEEQGYHGHIFNDSPGRIEHAIDVGYEFVSKEEIGGISTNVVSRNTDVGDKVRFLVGTAETGEALYAYLMKIRQEFYEEDQNDAQSKIDLVDEAIRGGRLTGDGQSADHRYDAGIKISRN
jgi:hypothetical protein